MQAETGYRSQLERANALEKKGNELTEKIKELEEKIRFTEEENSALKCKQRKNVTCQTELGDDEVSDLNECGCY